VRSHLISFVYVVPTSYTHLQFKFSGDWRVSLLAYVGGMRCAVRNSKLRDIFVQEVVFKITDASLPNLTMVDLPGLPAPTDEMYEEVKRLVNREVQNPHNIVLCIDW
jgi:hypothetical protein